MNALAPTVSTRVLGQAAHSQGLPDFHRVERFRLEWLVSFVAVAHHGGVLAAAQHLYRSQPRVSCHIADLEQALGTTLLDRSMRPVALTSSGTALLSYAEHILSSVQDLASAATGAEGGR